MDRKPFLAQLQRRLRHLRQRLRAEAREHGDQAVERGIRYLIDTQRDDGGWDEELFTGTGFPGDFYINYEMYRLLFPLSALGRYAGSAR